MDPDPDFNLEEGEICTVLDRMLQKRARNGGTAARHGRLQEGNNAVASLEEAKRLTSGIMIGNGIHCLNNPGVQSKVNTQKAVKLAAQLEDLR
jgi:hypothetical protein